MSKEAFTSGCGACFGYFKALKVRRAVHISEAVRAAYPKVVELMREMNAAGGKWTFEDGQEDFVKAKVQAYNKKRSASLLALVAKTEMGSLCEKIKRGAKIKTDIKPEEPSICTCMRAFVFVLCLWFSMSLGLCIAICEWVFAFVSACVSLSMSALVFAVASERTRWAHASCSCSVHAVKTWQAAGADSKHKQQRTTAAAATAATCGSVRQRRQEALIGKSRQRQKQQQCQKQQQSDGQLAGQPADSQQPARLPASQLASQPTKKPASKQQTDSS